MKGNNSRVLNKWQVESLAKQGIIIKILSPANSHKLSDYLTIVVNDHAK